MRYAMRSDLLPCLRVAADITALSGPTRSPAYVLTTYGTAAIVGPLPPFLFFSLHAELRGPAGISTVRAATNRLPLSESRSER